MYTHIAVVNEAVVTARNVRSKQSTRYKTSQANGRMFWDDISTSVDGGEPGAVHS